jgi:hypothetical protein
MPHVVIGVLLTMTQGGPQIKTKHEVTPCCASEEPRGKSTQCAFLASTTYNMISPLEIPAQSRPKGPR